MRNIQINKGKLKGIKSVQRYAGMRLNLILIVCIFPMACNIIVLNKLIIYCKKNEPLWLYQIIKYNVHICIYYIGCVAHDICIIHIQAFSSLKY